MDYNLLIKHLLILKCFLIIMLLLGVEMDAWAHNNKTTGSLTGSEDAIVQCNRVLIEQFVLLDNSHRQLYLCEATR